ncbi:MAG: hypothetical protein AAB795_04280 [Patescibacteria group bacterium]
MDEKPVKDKDVLAQYNNKLIRLKADIDTGNGINTVSHYVIVVGDKTYLLYCYSLGECFGINPQTGNPRVLISNINPSLDYLKNVSVVPMDESILSALCEILKTGSFDGDGEAQIKIGPINCEVRFLASFKEKALLS